MSGCFGQISLPEIWLKRGHAKRIRDGDGFKITVIGQQPLRSLLEAEFIALHMDSQHVWPGCAGVFARSDGLVDGQIIALVQSRLDEFAVQQRSRRNAKGRCTGRPKRR